MFAHLNNIYKNNTNNIIKNVTLAMICTIAMSLCKFGGFMLAASQCTNMITREH